MPDIGLNTSLRVALGIPSATKLDKLGLVTVGDLLLYYPRRYDHLGKLSDFAAMRVGDRVVVQATVQSVSSRRPKSASKVRTITDVVISDGKGRLTCTFFNQAYLERTLAAGSTAIFAGVISQFRETKQLTSPQVTVLGGPKAEKDVDKNLDRVELLAGGVIPIYALVDGVRLGQVQACVAAVLRLLPPLADPLPEVLLAERGLADFDTAIRDVHRPTGFAALEVARQRLRYDEALAIQLVLAQRRAAARAEPAVACAVRPDGVLSAFDASLPFELTAGQREVGAQIAADLAGTHPMNRLLQGEVGSGKTLVALRAMLQVTDAGRQAVLLAPTEVLAAQHYRSLADALGPFGRGGELGAPEESVALTLLTGSMTARAKAGVRAALAEGTAGIAVGTHALLSGPVSFARLGLVVVDEQHRFGVEQRDTLRGKQSDGSPPHMLVMTATPIPRTVAMTVYGDLETSTLTELPRGRSPIATTVVPASDKPEWLDRAWTRVREEVAKGHQVFVVCPKIGDSESSDLADDADGYDDIGGDDERAAPLSVLEVADTLRSGPLAQVRLGVVHGRLPPAEKDDVMVAFSAGLIDVLVATTVIEVGVDVPNATVMVVMDAERFGLSQLHQLRGRVGRGSAASLCLLVTRIGEGHPAMERLRAVASTTDGFELADKDLELRREGNVLGTAQAGRSSGLRQLVLLRDREVIETARDDARRLIGDDPDLSRAPGLAALVASTVAEDDRAYLEKS